MEEAPPASAAMGPPMNSSPEMEHEGPNGIVSQNDGGHTVNGVPCGPLSAAAVASAQQPKVVQTAFIHKLYR